VIEQIELLADMLELEGTEAFRVLAYRRAAQRIGETGGSIAQLALDGKAKELQGIGKTIEEKIVQIVEKGEIEALTKRRERIPADVVAFMRLPGLGPKTARRIWLELDVTTLAGLREAAEQQRLRTLTGLGPKVEENVLKALRSAPSRRRLRGRCSARACRRCSRRSRRCARTRPPSRSPRQAACAAGERPSATSTSSPPRPTRRA
jgi:DNA polymerase/3'-5' exonuclease PolX